MSKKLWGGRFSKSTDKKVEEFTSSIGVDKKLYKKDIDGSIAHVKMLRKQKIIKSSDATKIIKTLSKIEIQIDKGNFVYEESLEDIHMNIENSLIKRIGDIGKKIHTARSRNDQVVTDLRLYVKDNLKLLNDLLINLIKTLVKISEKNIKIIIPFYTHLQKAQPILASHFINSYIEMFLRDMTRLKHAYDISDVSPLGSCAGAGTSFNIDRKLTAKLLGFKEISRNSLDSVSDRDFVADAIYSCSMLMMHFSRFCEDLIIWNSSEFGFIKIGDSFTTGSSIMPQKKNPDILELIRGKCGSVYGNLNNILVNLKGLPSSYNRDLQEDKEPLFSSFKTAMECTGIFTDMIKSVVFNTDKIKSSINSGFMTATDIADYLVKKGIPFRDAHKITGKIVLHCEKNNQILSDLKIEELKKFSKKIEIDIFKFITNEYSLESKKSFGGTSTVMVKKSISKYKKIIDKF